MEIKMSNPEYFSQTRTNPRQLFPFPEDGRVVEENPPCLSWLPVGGSVTYKVVLYRGGSELWSGETQKNYIVPDIPLESGDYTWDIFADGRRRGLWNFTIADYAVKIKRVTAEELYDSIPAEHPRHLFSTSDIPEILRARQTELAVLRRNIDTAYANGMPERPMYHRDPAALPYREFFGRFRDYCDRDLVACSLGYALLGDEMAGAYAKELLLTICDWNPHGPCSLLGPWGDEIGLSCSRCLPSVYDLLWQLLDDKERRYVAYTVRTYAEQCWIRLKKLDYCANPGDSHAGRIAAYLGEAALVLKDSGIQSREEALNWLDYALDIYGGIFPYFGTPDGGWAEGTFYSTSYTRWYLPFFCAVERYSGCAFLDRPFYQRLTQFFLHFANPAHENHPFGDGYWCHPEDKEWPGFFAQNPFRLYADRFGPPEAKRLSDDAAEQNIYLLHLLDVFIPDRASTQAALTGKAENVQCFPDAGFVSMHTDLLNGSGDDLAVMARASKFGSDSHRHADQGSFALFSNGKALISPSGYFGRGYGTNHHFKWTKTTKAHNALLIDGEGQPWNSIESRGRIVECRDDGAVKTAVLDLSSAYPMLTLWRRTLQLEKDLLTVIDEVEADKLVTVTYPLHTLSKPKAEGKRVHVVRGGRHLTISPVEGDLGLPELSDKYDTDLNDGVPAEFAADMPNQYHIYYKTAPSEKHRIVVRFEVRGE
ncbi:MAG: DUF4962 domain-containing protein [Clostridiales bacterium]|nr:DUF4962 domain-containing protein [Clostridiales bacterium]